MKPKTFLLVLFLNFVGVHGLQAAPATAQDASKTQFDSAAIERAYSDGEFDEGIRLATQAWKQGTGLKKADSVFLCKYLGVMLGADANKRENAKYFMNRMLILDSSETVMNLYASDAIYEMFQRVQTEFRLNQRANPMASGTTAPMAAKSDGSPSLAAAPNTPQNGATAPLAGKKGSPLQSKWLWAVGGTALVGVGVGLVAILGSEPEKPGQQVVLPVTLPQP